MIRLFPEERDRTLRRVFVAAIALFPLVVAGAAFWGLESAASAAAGGLLILLCGLWTHAAVRGQIGISAKRMRRRIWWRAGWRFGLLAVGVYAILHAPWLRLEPFIAGLSLFFPAILVELVFEMSERGERA